MGEMTRVEKVANLGAVVVPFAATLAAIVLLWNSLVTPADLAIAAAMYLLTAIGITVGFHPPAHPSLLPNRQAGRIHIRGPRLDGRAGPGDLLGGGPP